MGTGEGTGMDMGMGVDRGVDTDVNEGMDRDMDSRYGCGHGCDQGRGHRHACLTGYLRPPVSDHSASDQEPQTWEGAPRVNLGQSPCRSNGVTPQVPWGLCPQPASCPRCAPTPTVCSAPACWALTSVCGPHGNICPKQRAPQLTLLE